MRFDAVASPQVELEGGSLFALAAVGLTAGTSYAIRVTNPGGRADTLQAAFQAVTPTLARVNGSRLFGPAGLE